MTPPNDNPGKEPLARSLGRFFGHIARGITSDVTKDTTRHEVSRNVEEEERVDDSGRKVTLRRTTIEEVEIEEEGTRR